MPIRVGNLMETSLAKLYYESELFRELRDRNRVSEGCEGCVLTRRVQANLLCALRSHPPEYVGSRGNRSVVSSV